MKVYLAQLVQKRADQYHFPDPLYDATAACHARTVIDYEHGMEQKYVPDDQRCGRPGCRTKW